MARTLKPLRIVPLDQSGDEGFPDGSSPKPMRIVPLDQEMRKLRANIEAMERRYEISSEDMRQAVLAGTMRETFEVCEWMTDYWLLREIMASDEYAASNGSAPTS